MGRWGEAGPGRCAKAKEIPAATANATAVAAAKRRRLFMWGRILGGSKKVDLFMRIGALVRGCKEIVLRIAERAFQVEGQRVPDGRPFPRRARAPGDPARGRGGATVPASVQCPACRSTGASPESPPVRSVDDLVAWFREREHPAGDLEGGHRVRGPAPGRGDPRPGPLRRTAWHRGRAAGLLPVRLRPVRGERPGHRRPEGRPHRLHRAGRPGRALRPPLPGRPRRRRGAGPAPGDWARRSVPSWGSSSWRRGTGPGARRRRPAGSRRSGTR